jgi:hypothetical protein
MLLPLLLDALHARHSEADSGKQQEMPAQV